VLLRLGRERVKNAVGDFSFSNSKAMFGILYNVPSVSEAMRSLLFAVRR